MLIEGTDLFQLGYVVADLDRALASTLPAMGITHLYFARGGPVRDGTRRIGIAYRGAMMVEFIEPGDDPDPLYADTLRAAGDSPLLHHLGYLVDDGGWARVQAHAHASALAVDRQGSHAGVMDYIYIDARTLCGHRLEYIHLLPGGDAFFQPAPRF